MRLIHPTYFPSILSYALMINSDDLLFEVSDFYEKQTYRNRLYLQSANGKQMLSVQVKHTHKDGKQLYKDVQISDDFDWQKLHWRSLETAYRTSPYFEFYEDDLRPLFEDKHRFLVDLNVKIFETLNDLLDVSKSYELTKTYQTDISGEDLRFLKNAKKPPTLVDEMPKYTQMFLDRHDFMPNLSILDLLFMEGPNALTYLEQINDLWSQKNQAYENRF
jgi:hypothetical protein